MDIIRLGLPGDYSYIPDTLIDIFSSKIWTERYQEPGEFEFRTPQVDEALRLLPTDTFVSLMDTEEVMKVETHTIEKSEEGYPEIVVAGRTVDSVLEHRHVESKYQKKRTMARDYSPGGAALVLLWNAIDNTTGKDVSREEGYSQTIRDALPSVMVTDSINSPANARGWRLAEGPLYDQFMNILIRGDLGIRSIRPYGTSGVKVHINSNANENFGNIIRTPVTDIAQLRFDIFSGTDRSHEQSSVPEVAFNVIQGDFEGETYLFSVQEYKTACEIMSGKGGADVYRNDAQRQLTGWDRRVMSYDAGEPEEPDKPDDPGKGATAAQNQKYEEDLARWRNRVADITAKFLKDAEEDALRSLKKARKISMFSGDISALATHTFKQDYNLGDAVTLYGNYGQVEKMIVSEYVRTEDDEGDRGYPGLIQPEA